VSQAFKQCLNSLQAESSRQTFFVPVQGKDQQDSLVLSLKKRDDSSDTVVIYLRSMCIPDGVLPGHFSEEFGLSSRESRLAAGLMRGKDLLQLAAEFHVSRHTLRTQLKSMLRKTGANSQVALIMLILRNSAITLE
jgi:DNA-binding CsgD family transcriptional regulator